MKLHINWRIYRVSGNDPIVKYRVFIVNAKGQAIPLTTKSEGLYSVYKRGRSRVSVACRIIYAASSAYESLGHKVTTHQCDGLQDLNYNMNLEPPMADPAA